MKRCKVSQACMIVYPRSSREKVARFCFHIMELWKRNQAKKKIVKQRITKSDKEEGEANHNGKFKDNIYKFNYQIRKQKLYEYHVEIPQKLYAPHMMQKSNQKGTIKLHSSLSDMHDLNHNRKEPVKFGFQSLQDLYAEIPGKKNCAFNMEMNPSLGEKKCFIDISKEKMDDAGEHEEFSSVDGSHHHTSTPNL
ncbi:hypothetical protein N665_2135s0001 [Sinapis alba]|nr:hypothetical protein N665_2135s0001 [Sinapis alba]